MKAYATHLLRFLLLAAIIAPLFAVGYYWHAPVGDVAPPLFFGGFIAAFAACGIGNAVVGNGFLWMMTAVGGVFLLMGGLVAAHGIMAAVIGMLWVTAIALSLATYAWHKI